MPFFKTMNKNYFTEVIKFIRFDKKSKLRKHLQTNKFAMISTIWEQFIKNPQNCYKLSTYIAFD